MIAGIDFSTNAIDIVLVDEETRSVTWTRCDLTEDAATGDRTGAAFDRARRVRAAMPTSSWWEDHGVIAIGIEQPRGNFGVTPLFRIQGAVLACLPTRILVAPWNPASWRVACGMKGNATKQEVMFHAKCMIDLPDLAMTQELDWPQDAFDAYCIAVATARAVERTEVG